MHKNFKQNTFDFSVLLTKVEDSHTYKRLAYLITYAQKKIIIKMICTKFIESNNLSHRYIHI